MPLFPFNRDTQKRVKKPNLKFPVIILAVILIIIVVTNRERENRFPYLILEGNIVLSIELKRKGISLKDTISAIYKDTDVFFRRKSKIGFYLEKEGIFKEKFKVINSEVISEYNKFPFFSLNDSISNGLVSLNIEREITKAKFPLIQGESWLDEDIGLISEFVDYDTLKIMGKKRECYKFIRFINEEKRNKIISFVKGKRNKIKVQLYKEINRNINSLWTEWYTRDIGWVKSKYPNGDIETVINIEDIYWYERIPRLLGFGVK